MDLAKVKNSDGIWFQESLKRSVAWEEYVVMQFVYSTDFLSSAINFKDFSFLMSIDWSLEWWHIFYAFLIVGKNSLRNIEQTFKITEWIQNPMRRFCLWNLIIFHDSCLLMRHHPELKTPDKKEFLMLLRWGSDMTGIWYTEVTL